MKTKTLCIAFFASTAVIAQANPAGSQGGGEGFRRGAVVRSAPVTRAPVTRGPVRSRSVSSFRSMPTRSLSGTMTHPGQRYSSFGTRSYRSSGFRQRSIYPNLVTFTRSGPFTAATIRQPNQTSRMPRFANRRNPAATNVWNQRNTGSQFRHGNNVRNANNIRNGNNRLRGDWHKHVFARHSGDWHHDWDHHTDHWWNGHRCCFINGSWVIFSLGFYPWSPWSYPDDYYYSYGLPYNGYDSPYSGYDYPYSYNYDPGYDNSGDYQGQMYYDQNSYPGQSQDYYDSAVYQTEAYSDGDGYADESQPNYSTVVAAQERLARQGYYHGETDGVLSPEMQKAVKRYQSTNGLRTTGYLDSDTLAVMGLP